MSTRYFNAVSFGRFIPSARVFICLLILLIYYRVNKNSIEPPLLVRSYLFVCLSLQLSWNFARGFGPTPALSRRCYIARVNVIVGVSVSFFKTIDSIRDSLWELLFLQPSIYAVKPSWHLLARTSWWRKVPRQPSLKKLSDFPCTWSSK